MRSNQVIVSALSLLLFTACHKQEEATQSKAVAAKPEQSETSPVKTKDEVSVATAEPIKLVPDSAPQSPESRDLARRQALQQFKDARKAKP